MTAQAGAVAAHNPYQRAYVAAYATMAPAAQLKPLLAAIDDLREQARAFSETAAVPVEALEGLLDKAQFLVDGLDEEYVAWPTRVLMLRAELTKLTQLIKERSNG